ncbi:MAG: SsrA-binding protein SmpB [Bacteroidota bacterium]|nr:SsrA-binding protein SmpB [Bacteroidota bacterium]MDP4205020.1 SsrA-binding protein SmpB [Bacteroidota bacterium]
MTHKAQDIRIKNKRATFEYELLERVVAGIQLLGTEIKSIRMGKAGLTEAYCHIYNHEVFIKNMNITEYIYGTCNNHDARRERKLLLTSREIFKLERKVKETGLTIVPVCLFINERGLAKLEISLARGKKTYDKREDLKKKDARREIDRSMKH